MNEIWTKNSESQVGALSDMTGIEEKNIVTESASSYNRPSNPDMGGGVTLNQGTSNALGRPEFFAGNGRAGIKNGYIYKVEGSEIVPVATIDQFGKISIIGD